MKIIANLSVPCNFVSREVSYKYIVQKKSMKNSREKPEVVWEHLVNWGPKGNRCLHIPMERIAREGICFFLLSNFFFLTELRFVPRSAPSIAALRCAHTWKLDLGLELALL